MVTSIKLAIFDFDGTFTNGLVLFNNDGQVEKSYNVKDGMGIKMLKNQGIKTCIISGFKKNPSFLHICKHLDIDYIYDECENKKDTITTLINKIDLTFNQISYMGDDINDIDILKNVICTGCPNNAVQEVKQNSQFISQYNGGEGAVREFCEYILQKKNFSALVCIKYFSKRLPQKNFLTFGNTTLINNKIDTLLSLDFLNEIIVNTESEELISIVKKSYENNKKVKIVKREEKYSLETTESIDFCKNVAETCNYDNILYSPITCPLITKNTYEEMYKNYKSKKFDSVVLVSDGIKGQGHTGEKHNFCFGCCMISKKDMIEKGDTIGNNYYIQECNRIERIDIDYYSDYKRALYYFYNREQPYNEDILQFLSNPLYNLNNNSNLISNKKIKVLDCSIRDGGFTNNWNFTYEEVIEMINVAISLNLEYFELGYLIDKKYLNDKQGIWRNCDFDLIKKIKNEINGDIKISIMIDHWRFDFNKLPNQNDSGIDLIRICNYIENIEDTIITCKKLNKKGYKTSVNIIASSYLTNIDLIKIKAFMLTEKYVDWYYFADSYGSMIPTDIEEIISFFKNDPRTQNINIGFHAHNNSQISMANTLKAIECGVDMIDGTYGGKGRGGGNLPLENIILYLKIRKKYNFDISLFLDFVYKFYRNENLNIKFVRETIAGFMNVHPYRLDMYEETSNLNILYSELNNLSEAKKKDYKL